MNKRIGVGAWWCFALVLIAAIIAMLFSSCSTGRSHYRPSETWTVDTSPPRWYEATPGDIYRPAWEYAKACSGLQEQPGGRYEDVYWLVVSPRGLRDDKGKRIIGVWLAPDTLVLDSMWIQSAWLVAHELLHHLRQVTGEDDPHPHVPFTWPCMLMYFQNVAGGLLAKEHMAPELVGSPVQLPGGSIMLRFIGESVRREEVGEP